jgi:hypothetical protein
LKENAKQGFDPTNFYSSETISKELHMESNGVRYKIISNGAPQRENIPTENIDAQQASVRNNTMRYVFTAFFLVSFIFGAYVVVSAKKKDKQNKRER